MNLPILYFLVLIKLFSKGSRKRASTSDRRTYLRTKVIKYNVLDRFWEVLKKSGSFRKITSIVGAENSELGQEMACRDEIQKKRKRALERRRKVDEAVEKTGGPVLTDWEKDDVYADEGFYNKKVVECHQKNSRFRRARGWE